MKIQIKTDSEIRIIKEGGKRLEFVKESLREKIAPGVSAFEIDKLAFELIKKQSASPSFMMVPNYSWTTCININDGIVHGIPHKHLVFKNNDIVSVDVGLFYKGFHTDTSFSVLLGEDDSRRKFLEIGREALRLAIKNAKAGNYVFDVSYSIESTLIKNNLTPIEDLVGHGIGRKLHEDPQIPCFTRGQIRNKTPQILPGMVFAIEVMYKEYGSAQVKLAKDGWTITTSDGKISGLFEETVIVEKSGPFVATARRK
ncbi:MAG: type I methionyl aminopeptidase [Patescibacteria group bacterium]|nr:type I methionyl aminopeptidase [Patescibacteria group bacterium]